MVAGDLGVIDTPTQRKRHQVSVALDGGAEWCADNGCFGKGYPGDEAWFSWLEGRAAFADRCWFATAPDVVGDAEMTLARSLPWLPRIRALGYPAALVAQDGLERLTVPWDAFDVLFLGGSTDWKLGPHARELVTEARSRGKRVHMGRVNTARRWRYADAIGCDSVDGTILTFGVDANLPRVLGWSADRPLF